jgi:hypothetical protein
VIIGNGMAPELETRIREIAEEEERIFIFWNNCVLIVINE